MRTVVEQILACDVPLLRGPNKGELATGTAAGYKRHRQVDEEPCEACLLTKREAARRWREENPERAKANNRRWRAENPERARSIDRRWGAANAEKVNDKNRRWYEANREKARASNRRWREDNLDQARANSRRWNAENPERVKDKSRRWREENPGKQAAAARRWAKANLGRVAQTEARRRARKRNALTIAFTQDELDARMSMFGLRCWMCRGPFEHVDHVIALARGGPHVLSNLRPACQSCNTAKGSKDWREVMQNR